MFPIIAVYDLQDLHELGTHVGAWKASSLAASHALPLFEKHLPTSAIFEVARAFMASEEIDDALKATYTMIVARKSFHRAAWAAIVRYKCQFSGLEFDPSVNAALLRLAREAGGLMTPEELAQYNGLPQNVEVWRGISGPRKRILGQSWTLSRDVAERYATDAGMPTGTYFRALVQRENVHAFVNEFGEAEIILDPRAVNVVDCYQAGFIDD